MKNEIKEIIAERIKYHSNKQKHGYFMGNECIDICASDILDDVIKAGYRKQSEVAREVISKVMAILSGIKKVKGEDCFFTYEGNCDEIDEQLNRLAEQYGKEEA